MNTLKKVQYNAPVVLTFTLLSGLALFIGYLTGGKTTSYLFTVYRGSLVDPLFYVRLLTHVMGHASWAHFINNFMVILLVGPMLEEKYGSKHLFIMIAFTALVTGIINVICFKTGLLGASGVAFMMVLLSSFGGSKERTIPLTLILVAILYIGNEVITGVLSADHISQFTHIIGGICGCGLGFYYNHKR